MLPTRVRAMGGRGAEATGLDGGLAVRVRPLRERDNSCELWGVSGVSSEKLTCGVDFNAVLIVIVSVATRLNRGGGRSGVLLK
jgi:hypothetical protein